MLPLLMVAPTDAGLLVGLQEGLVMRHKPILDSYTAGMIGLALLPIAMAFGAVLIP